MNPPVKYTAAQREPADLYCIVASTMKMDAKAKLTRRNPILLIETK